MPKMPGSTRAALCASASAVVREALRLLKIGYESGYKTRRRGAIVSSGAGLLAQLPFNV
jgi:Arc/MetJ-type ribon-helix-helix transcriptional regulator